MEGMIPTEISPLLGSEVFRVGNPEMESEDGFISNAVCGLDVEEKNQCSKVWRKLRKGKKIMMFM